MTDIDFPKLFFLNDAIIVEELDLPDSKDQDILKDEIIILSSEKAVEKGINKHKIKVGKSIQGR